jgi:hypothetical protein
MKKSILTKSKFVLIAQLFICRFLYAQDEGALTYRSSFAYMENAINLNIEFINEKVFTVSFSKANEPLVKVEKIKLYELNGEILESIYKTTFPIIIKTDSTEIASDSSKQKKDSLKTAEFDKNSKSGLLKEMEFQVKKAKAFYLDKSNNREADELGMTNEELLEYNVLKQNFENKSEEFLKAKLKLNRKVRFNKQFERHNANRKIIKPYIIKKKIAAKEFKRYASDKIQPSIFLSGTALSVLNGGLNNDSVKSNVLSLGFHGNKFNSWDFDADITFSQNEDIVTGNNRSQFGTTILVPGIRKFSLLTNYKVYNIFRAASTHFWKSIGASISFNATQISWKWNGPDSLQINGNNAVRAVPFAANALLNYNWMFAKKGRTNLLENTIISTDIGIATRWIFGDVGQSDLLLNKFLGSTKIFYAGALLGLNIKVQRITIFYNGIVIPNWYFGYIPGLTGGQVVSSLGFRADVVKL